MARMVFNARTLGAFIKDARTVQGLTQQQLAEQAGVSRSWLIGVEQGKRSGAEMSKIFALLSALNTPMIFDEPARTPLSEADPEATIKPQKFSTPYLNTFDLGVKNILQAQIAAWAAPSGITAALNQQKPQKSQEQRLPAKEDDGNPQGRA